MSQTRFPNVCLLLGASTDPEYFFIIVQEYVSGGDLAALCRENKLPSSFYARMRLASQVARGMIWIHAAGILHRDLKLENLLIDKYGEVKVCDFGLSDLTGDKEFIVDEYGMKGSPLYMAPEVLEEQNINKKADVYSFGLILWELLAKQRAFQHHRKKRKFIIAICLNKERPPLPPLNQEDQEEWKRPEIKNIINQCWHPVSKKRPDFVKIYERLNSIITGGNIKDEWGYNFWLVNFHDKDEVTWDEFVRALVSDKKIPLNDGSSFPMGLFIQESSSLKQTFRCLKIILSQISGIEESSLSVSSENFGKLLEWFGPGVNVDDTHKIFLDRLLNICSNPWFHGCISSTAASKLLSTHTSHFMVRLSSIPGSYTVQTPTTCVRIHHTPNTGYQPQGGNVYPTLKDLIKDIIPPQLQECPESAFSTVSTEKYIPYVMLPDMLQVGALMTNRSRGFEAYRTLRDSGGEGDSKKKKKKIKKRKESPRPFRQKEKSSEVSFKSVSGFEKQGTGDGMTNGDVKQKEKSSGEGGLASGKVGQQLERVGQQLERVCQQVGRG